MIWLQQRVTLAPRSRGFHLVTREIIEELQGLERIRVGLLHLLIQHTTASLALNENASPDVRRGLRVLVQRRGAGARPVLGSTPWRVLTTCRRT